MQLHLLILLSIADNWGEYIEYLHSIVKNMVRESFYEVLLYGWVFLLTLRCQNEKACFSDIENTPTYDYAITFADI
jgi:hypothetical protein